MQTILPSEFKRQMVLMLDGSPHVVEDMHTSGTAQTRHRLHTRLRHLTTGRVIDRVFAENERVLGGLRLLQRNGVQPRRYYDLLAAGLEVARRDVKPEVAAALFEKLPGEEVRREVDARWKKLQ